MDATSLVTRKLSEVPAGSLVLVEFEWLPRHFGLTVGITAESRVRPGVLVFEFRERENGGGVPTVISADFTTDLCIDLGSPVVETDLDSARSRPDRERDTDLLVSPEGIAMSAPIHQERGRTRWLISGREADRQLPALRIPLWAIGLRHGDQFIPVAKFGQPVGK